MREEKILLLQPFAGLNRSDRASSKGGAESKARKTIGSIGRSRGSGSQESQSSRVLPKQCCYRLGRAAREQASNLTWGVHRLSSKRHSFAWPRRPSDAPCPVGAIRGEANLREAGREPRVAAAMRTRADANGPARGSNLRRARRYRVGCPPAAPNRSRCFVHTASRLPWLSCGTAAPQRSSAPLLGNEPGRSLGRGAVLQPQPRGHEVPPSPEATGSPEHKARASLELPSAQHPGRFQSATALRATSIATATPRPGFRGTTITSQPNGHRLEASNHRHSLVSSGRTRECWRCRS